MKLCVMMWQTGKLKGLDICETLDEVLKAISQLKDMVDDLSKQVHTPQYYTVSQVAKYLRQSEQKVRRDCAAGKYHAEKSGKSWKIYDLDPV